MGALFSENFTTLKRRWSEISLLSHKKVLSPWLSYDLSFSLYIPLFFTICYRHQSSHFSLCSRGKNKISSGEEGRSSLLSIIIIICKKWGYFWIWPSKIFCSTKGEIVTLFSRFISLLRKTVHSLVNEVSLIFGLFHNFSVVKFFYHH